MPNRRELGYVSAGSTSTVYVSTGIYGRATGGIGSPTAVTISGVDYEYLTFTSTGTLTVTTAGWFDYLAVGGGGGAQDIGSGIAGGGGGAGQVIVGSVYLSANQTITIGAGSSKYSYTVTRNQAGNTSVGAGSPNLITALGNLNSNSGTTNLGYVGGGQGAGNNTNAFAATETTALGFNGGNSNNATTNAGGGGGQSGRGGNGSGTTGGTGGAGYDRSVFIGGSASLIAQGGGGGGSVTGGTAATGGVAGSATTTPSNGGANTGQGGGGGYGAITTGNGGSGICYIRWSVA